MGSKPCLKEYKRTCIYCETLFSTPMKFSEVCEECKEKNHSKKIMNSLFNGML